MEEAPKSIPYALLHEELAFANNWKLSPRVKFVSVDHTVVDQRFYAAFGTHTGSIYIFERIDVTLHHLTTLIKEEGVVICISFSPNGSRLACALNNGLLLVFSINLSNHQFECSRVSNQHKGKQVRAITWGGDDVIYSGDDTGFVSVTFVPVSKSQDLISVPSAPIQNLGSPIVQMDCHGTQICVSTEKSVSLFDTESRTFCTVGSKARHGKFGACFAVEKEGSAKLLCARPGYRIWQTNGDNVVTLTQLYKSFASSKATRIWGMPLKLKESKSRNGVLKYLRSLGNGLLAFVDALGNFYFVDFPSQTALDFLPCPANLLAFSLSPDGQAVLLLDSNRICLLRYAAPALALNLLASSEWIGDAVEFVVTACQADKELVMRHLELKPLQQLIEAAGEAEHHRAELLALLGDLREQRQRTLAELENRVRILGQEHEEESARRAEEAREETRSEVSEGSFTSSDFIDPERLMGPSKSRSSDLLLKVRTKLKETSSRVKQEMNSERAQNLMKKMKMKVDAGQLMSKVNMMPAIAGSEMDNGSALALEPENTDEEDSKMTRSVQRKPSNKPILNFVELEAAVFICWECAKVRYVNDQFQAHLGKLSDASFRRFKKALNDFQAVLGRLLNVFHFHLSPPPSLPAKEEAEVRKDEEDGEGEEGEEEEDKGEESEAAAEEMMSKDVEVMTVSPEFWRSFPTPVKVQELIGRISVLSFFVILTSDGDVERPTEEGEEGREGEIGVQASSVSDFLLQTRPAQSEEEAHLLEAVEAEFAAVQMHRDFGFVENALCDYLLTLHADVSFWRSCLQTIPISRTDFVRHFHSLRALLDDSVALYKNLDCSSMEFTNLLEKAIVGEKLLGFHLLEILFSKRPNQAVRFCVQNSMFVNHRDVFNLLSYHQKLSLWLDYIQQMREKENDEFIDILRENDDLFLATVIIAAACESKRAVPRTVCEACHFEIYLHPDTSQMQEDDLMMTLFNVHATSWAVESSERWLFRKGYWNSYCQALISKKRTDQLISIAFATDQKDMVSALPRLSREELFSIVTLMTRDQAPSCPLCGLQIGPALTSWSWHFIGDLISANLVAHKAVQLLTELEIPDEASCAPLFRRLISSVSAAATAAASRNFLPGGGTLAGSISSSCLEQWGKEISERSVCCLCGGRLSLGETEDEEVVIAPCCQNAFHASCLPDRSFCVVCLR